MNPMTPSVESKTTTDGQIIKAVSHYRALLEKYATGFNSDAVQLVLGQPSFTDKVFALFRASVEAVSNLITRIVAKVNRSVIPQQVLDNTGRRQYVDDAVVKTMPCGEGEGAQVFFFKLDLSKHGGFISNDDLDKEFDFRGLKPADPYSLAAVNQEDPAFADTHPNATHWKDPDGKWCYVAFIQWFVGERIVNVGRIGSSWDGRWWFGGVRK